MDSKYVKLEEFSAHWKNNEQNILQSGMIQVDSSIIQNADDFKKYFTNLIDIPLNNEGSFSKRQRSINMGGIYELNDLKLEYAMKVSYFQSQEIMFELVTPSNESEQAKRIMQNLIFLFGQ